MFGQRSVAPASGGLLVNTTSANALFGNKQNQPSTTSTAATQSGGNLFGDITSTAAPANTGNALGSSNPAPSSALSGSLFGGVSNTTTAGAGGIFSGLGSSTAAQPQTGTMFSTLGASVSNPGTTQTPQSGGIFGGLSSTTQPKATMGGSLFGQTPNTSQPQNKSAFGGFNATSNSGGGLFGASTLQPKQPQGPTLSLFANQNSSAKQDQKVTGSSIVQGVKIDISNLLPTTKFESCADELKKEIETIDTFILNQIHMCNEVSDLLPTISASIELIPNDVEFVQGKLDALQESLENDASGIEYARNLVKEDATNAKLAFRAIDTLLLPVQYQPSPGERWWSSTQQTPSISKHSLRTAFGSRRATLALPEDTEADSSHDGPNSLVDYFSRRSDEMGAVLEEYQKNMKEIEEHLHGVELSVQRQINELASSRGRNGTQHKPASRVNQLASTLGDVETAILGVAGRLGGVKEDVQEITLAPLGIHNNKVSGGW
ncbi:Nucleoporin nup49/NSP49 (Nuclear pore protein nup49/NSP49) [Ophidiomyces ophidiicola]|uniref:Nucleoporin nup49/NSP49 (Nuclear pore protein nup49/NSP49) n=1 Tax=Ophidiomyces ophidiicola TaxID=1387563 RepID=A0ACB8UU80_9EURO|nr:Nucleoporin nup49/NSP49 (Nuclear pore protein nup49/NSP49) [Ophidiomyces ophidiicola]KAI1917860.1 Nucleoporin nup49/NSP49 (Nuclear pore protein nup49/NSP49) [Ophidiomyces ophidiicola]KAI1929969.1 Nucleoporin nup49/NSP49 (Nuclear pore protein nup49/NSP49) [Ophidiomyces ophidiicola]KAI1955219.1 Nucleoporin nup49/NSP49 (Nuclear pore protein nup49/NSP49) [Ophidiomyces ophidiicola]KAI1967370.1 Nucleoporin nup49/NSP49 (Nuclear pore protein nup49/NSP49) [Ophidiomyces ophidiicola]